MVSVYISHTSAQRTENVAHPDMHGRGFGSTLGGSSLGRSVILELICI